MPVYPFESTIKDGNRTVQIGDQLLLPQKNNAANPSLAFGDGDTGFYESSPNVLSFSCGGVEFIYFDASGNIKTSTSGRWGLLNEAPTATNPNIVPNRSDVDTGIGAAALDQLSLIAGGVEALRISESAGVISVITPLKTITTATDTGIAGEICYDANYIYICTATNTWKRIGISTW